MSECDYCYICRTPRHLRVWSQFEMSYPCRWMLLEHDSLEGKPMDAHPYQDEEHTADDPHTHHCSDYFALYEDQRPAARDEIPFYSESS